MARKELLASTKFLHSAWSWHHHLKRYGKRLLWKGVRKNSKREIDNQMIDFNNWNEEDLWIPQARTDWKLEW